MCAEGMDGPVSTMKQSSHRGISQSSYSTAGMGAVDEEISAMLQSNHANMTGMMAPAASAPLDHLAAYQQAYAMYPPGYASSMQRPAAHVRPAQSRPRAAGFNLEEKYVLEAKSEVVHNYNPVYESAGLHRYHSAPATAFLAEMNEPGPQQQQQHLGNTVLGLYGDGGLTSISENLDSGGTNISAEYEHYMAPENDFARRLASFPATLCKEEVTTATLLRQSSIPSVGLSQLNAENASDKSSSRNSDDNNHLINGYTASMYSQEDFLWKSPTSPAKRQRGLEGESETSSGSVDGSTYRNGLVRHMSLPSPTSSPGVEGNSFTAVPMRTRAKRGCATHPRSIAERVRRTKISERMKRLQDLVPDMDKQTNTSDMLDETVEYVKSLQLKVQELQETVAQLRAAAAKQSINHNDTNLELGVAMDSSHG